MVNHNALLQRDLNHVWHPCTQMKDFEQDPPLIVHEAKGSYLYTDRGPVIDALSSWWCQSLGHGFPTVNKAISEQLSAFAHVIGSNTTYPGIVELAEQLAGITNLQHTFFASDGSSAVEIAMKLALHASKLQGYSSRNHFIALKNGYHGETIGALSVSDLGLYKEPYKGFGLPCHFLQTIPYVSSTEDPLWENCESIWPLVEQELEVYKTNACAIILEPIIQGVGNMRLYSADFLRRLASFAKTNRMYLIADEIMTGLGRTGKWLACHHAGIQPDMVCLSKGLTSGTLPLSTVSIDHNIYKLFYHDYTEGKSFLHSHTYSGNPLAVSAALATIKAMQAMDINQHVEELGSFMRHCFNEIATHTGKIINCRAIGGIVAGDLIDSDIPRLGYRIHQEALRRGALLRPLGNTLYWLPPLTTEKDVIEKLTDITIDSLKSVFA